MERDHEYQAQREGDTDVAIRRCRSCGQENRGDAVFCTRCSSEVAILCAVCQTLNDLDSTFCRRCRHRLKGIDAPGEPPAPLPTSFADDRYSVVGFLGEGAKKRVYLAHDTRLDRQVAISVIKTQGLDDIGMERTRREAHAMARLGDHPHIVTIHDVVEEAGRHYIVSEYMPSGSVDDLLERSEGRRLEMRDAVRIATEVAEALEHSHDLGVLHRDLKPSNVWLTRSRTAKLGDFGLAIALDRRRLSSEGTIIGTVSYMAPEQALGGAADPRSDLYSLGSMLYEMVTGQPPFEGADAVAVISQHINATPLAPSWHNASVPKRLDRLILKLLDKDVDSRPPKAGDVAAELRAIEAMSTADLSVDTPEPPDHVDLLAGGVFVGREDELAQLRRRLNDVLAGTGHVVLFAGEPGIGKTRICEEVATYARVKGARVLVGRSLEDEGSPPYWPWVQIIRAHIHGRHTRDLVTDLGQGAAEIAQFVSEIRDRLPDLPVPAERDPDTARFKLFDAVTTFFKNAARRAPIVILLDDIHWADRPTLALLEFLARQISQSRILILTAYRDEDVDRRHPLRRTLAELSRESLTTTIRLSGLTRDDIGALIQRTAGIEPPEPLLAAVHGETEGNAFFATQLVHLLVAEKRLQPTEEVTSWSLDIPHGVRQVITRRLERLSDACNRMLTIAAVIGREFSLELVGRMMDLPSDDLLDLADEALSARVLQESSEEVGHYRFTHALIRGTLYEELTTTQRVRLHRRVGEALEQQAHGRPDWHLAELAYHFGRAARFGCAQKAFEYSWRAADGAQARFAYEESVRLYETALQALELIDTATDVERCELLLLLGQAQTRAGDAITARENLLAAATLARELGSAEQLARAALSFGPGFMMFGQGKADEVLIELIEEALEFLPDADSASRARLLARLAVELYFGDEVERRERLSRESVEMATRLGDDAVLAYALNSRHHAIWNADTAWARLEIAMEIVRLSCLLNDKKLEMLGQNWLVIDLLEMGDIDGVDRAIEQFTRLTEELRQPAYLWLIPVYRAMRALFDGRLDEAEELISEALTAGTRAKHSNAPLAFGTQVTALRIQQGRSDEIVDAVEGFVGEFSAMPVWRAGLAKIQCELDRLDDAKQSLDMLALDDFASLPRDLTWLLIGALAAEVVNHLHDVGRAESLYELLAPYTDRTPVGGPGVISYGSTARYLGLLATTLERWDLAEQHFVAAIDANELMGARPWKAHSEYDYARLLVARGGSGDDAKALKLLDSALAVAQESGMKRLTEAALSLKFALQGIEGIDHKTSIHAVAQTVQRDQPDLSHHVGADGGVTILFTDIERFTEMIERLGDERTRAIIRAHNDIVASTVEAHGGVVVQSLGDGFMLAFPDAQNALACAIAIQEAMATAGFDEPLRVRIGLHSGEAIREGPLFFGRTVVMAARIADQARGGEILLSDATRQRLRSPSTFSFSDVRHVSLKGFSGDHPVVEAIPRQRRAKS